jgi:hypothetical protein
MERLGDEYYSVCYNNIDAGVLVLDPKNVAAKEFKNANSHLQMLC